MYTTVQYLYNLLYYITQKQPKTKTDVTPFQILEIEERTNITKSRLKTGSVPYRDGEIGMTHTTPYCSTHIHKSGWNTKKSAGRQTTTVPIHIPATYVCYSIAATFSDTESRKLNDGALVLPSKGRKVPSSIKELCRLIDHTYLRIPQY